MTRTHVAAALLAVTLAACESYTNPGQDTETDDPTYQGPDSGGKDGAPYEAERAAADSAAAR